MGDPDIQRYREAKRIAEQLLGLDPPARRARMAQLCSDDEALQQQVAWLIAAAEDSTQDDVPERFQSAARSALKAVSLEVPMPRNYRLLERLDAGSSGVVYRAERVDGPVAQLVALKLLSPAEEVDAVLAERFGNERQALARLNHPNIAHLIDGGLTAEGRPFLATEYVDGEPINAWCQARNASLGQRLELMIKVCAAVDYAHRHMVIHRDLKPSNILVTADGEPKLLDFGIARLLDIRLPGVSEQDGRFMTIAYASPEQAAGRPLSAASDVYSLGVILHELLTGVRPLDDIDDLQERLQTLQIRNPPALRDRLRSAPDRGVAGISADLEAIAQKALARSPDDRYTSARDLADDLRRLLQHRPVAARGAGSVYRFERFVARHRLGAGLCVLASVLLVSFLLDREKQLQRIAWERDRAEAVTGFMNEVFSGADSLPSRGNAVTVREILDLGSDRVATGEFFNPTALGSIQLALGRAYNALGLGEQALPLLVQARVEMPDGTPPAERARIESEIAAALDSAGRGLEAIAADDRAIALLSQTAAAPADEVLRLRLRKLRNHANVMDIPLEQTVAELEVIAAELTARPAASRELLFEAQAALVAAYVFQNRADEALSLANAAAALVTELYAENDPRRLRGRHVYATALMLTDPNAAIERFEELVSDHQRLIGPSQRLANTLGNLGVALARAERISEAIEAFAKAAEMIENVAGRDHYLYRLSLSNRAALHLRVSEPEVAEHLVRELLESSGTGAEPAAGIEASYRASALDILGSALALQDRLDEAADTYRQALALLATEQRQETEALRITLAQRLAVVENERAERPQPR